MEFVKNITTDSNSIEFLVDYIPDRVFVFNKTNKTIYEKYNGELIPVGSEDAYNKGVKALHYEGEVDKVSSLNQNAADYSVFLIKNDSTTYQNRKVNSLFIKLPGGNTYQEVRLNTYSTMEVDKFINDEETARENADITLQDNIEAEATNRENADSDLSDAISAETSARESADSDLSDAIIAEESARQGADSDLSDAIDAEASERADVDSALQDDIDAINQLLEDNIDFENNKVIQYAGPLTAPPSDFSNYKIGTCWKITQDFTLNGEDIPKDTFIFKKDELSLDVLGGGVSKKAVFEEARVVSENDTVWVANLYLGNTQTKGQYMIFNNYNSQEQTYSYGHFLIRGPSNVYSFDVLLNQANGVLNNYWTQGNGAPVECYSCKYGNDTYIALRITSSNENYDVYYTGWVSSDFEPFNYTQSDLSDFSPIALGELDINNLPKGSTVAYDIPRFRYSSDSRESITEYWDNWDWDTYPVAYIRPGLSGNGNTRSLDLTYIMGNNAQSEWRTQNLNALKHILGDETKPTYLILDQFTNLNSCTVSQIGQFFGGVSNPFPGLKGLYMPQDRNSNYCGQNWWGSDTNNLFLVNYDGLEYLKLNQYIESMGYYSVRDLDNLKSITMPAALTTLDFNDDRPLIQCPNLTTIILPSETNVVTINGTYGQVLADFFWRDGAQILVRRNLLNAYKRQYVNDGYVLALVRGY